VARAPELRHGPRARARPLEVVSKGWDESAIVLGPPTDVRDRLVTELVVFGYRPIVPEAGRLALDADERASVALLITDHGDEPNKILEAFAIEALRGVPILWILPEKGLELLRGADQLYDEFIQTPYETEELHARLELLRRRTGREGPDVIRRGPVVLNVATYQATLEGRPLDLTYMEYELLKLFFEHPGRVFTREAILSGVWRYDYYGGLRTVDVHVRRLRAKLGRDHAGLVETVRGVGYRLAQGL
jgi:DNA-binding response OmpR family regulator